ncbi:MAG: methyltransferase domain-containing protein [Thermoclostridium sp.]|nr:methyltransferase domain-containing protein [Thermoclostridium sp.]
MADWNSSQYLKFKNERTQPAIDLLNRIDTVNPEKIADLGCGPGNSTQVLAQRFKDAYILGVDSSQNMITAAEEKYPELDFKICDISCELSQLDHDFDIVFSNACIQWVPDHPGLIPRMLGLLKEGGVLAVQIPMNFDEPIHRIIMEVSSSEKWCACFAQQRVFYTLSLGEYFDVLSDCTDEFSIWDTTYYHVMKSWQDIMEWYRSTGLRPYLSVLAEDRTEEFEEDILQMLIKAYPKQKNGEILFRFPRFFFMARRK